MNRIFLTLNEVLRHSKKYFKNLSHLSQNPDFHLSILTLKSEFQPILTLYKEFFVLFSTLSVKAVYQSSLVKDGHEDFIKLFPFVFANNQKDLTSF